MEIRQPCGKSALDYRYGDGMAPLADAQPNSLNRVLNAAQTQKD
jgi:hypothetical protein